jgi:hypothetical protein
MNVWPAVLDVRVAQPDHRPVHLWLPIVLLWPAILAAAAIALVFTVIADVVLLLLGSPYHHYTVLLVHSLGALGATRGMVIRVNDDKAAVDMTVK